MIKAFNNIYARHLLERGLPKGAPGRIALPVAGDDAAAKAVVLKLVDALGFDAVDAGGLDESCAPATWLARLRQGLRRGGCTCGAGGGLRGAGSAARHVRQPWRVHHAGLSGLAEHARVRRLAP